MAGITGGVFNRGLYALEALGLSDILLPFLLVFTLVFAVLQKSKILGDESKKFNVIIALIMGFGVVIPHSFGVYPGSVDVVDIINRSLPNVSVIIIMVIMVLLLIGVFGWEAKGGGTLSGLVAVISLIVVVFIFGSAAQWWNIPYIFWWLQDWDIQALVIIILVFGLIVWFITGDEEKKKGDSFLEGIGKWFK